MADNTKARPSSVARDGGRTKGMGEKNGSFYGNHKFRANNGTIRENKKSIPQSGIAE